ncbi:DUF1203 domain-containing protein [Ulvibacter antarcticus]|uniref:Uncharacterized protein DUF1203 n=1 Tax=Ulvibacter antarcticus TaxID=442714 RepID=A0A3L9YY89_9FLAO|nr:DUF1203 domain-containing protein [Ulvibacter antarcticus]RMA64800.1 uncharacterized protein DUF1203 [Ulvibacter antarcticus]
MDFQISALDDTIFHAFFKLNDTELEKIGGKRMIVDENPGYPCRVSLEDAEIGEKIILIPFEHHKTQSPYQAKGPIFIREGIKTKTLKKNEIPKMLDHRLLSFRGYDKNGFMKSAITEKGNETKQIIEKIFQKKEIQYIHIHNSSPGCYNCQVTRI